jgi:hypothetical protein
MIAAVEILNLKCLIPLFFLNRRDSSGSRAAEFLENTHG